MIKQTRKKTKMFYLGWSVWLEPFNWSLNVLNCTLPVQTFHQMLCLSNIQSNFSTVQTEKEKTSRNALDKVTILLESVHILWNANSIPNWLNRKATKHMILLWNKCSIPSTKLGYVGCMILYLIIYSPPLLQNHNSRSIFFANNISIKSLQIQGRIRIWDNTSKVFIVIHKKHQGCYLQSWLYYRIYGFDHQIYILFAIRDFFPHINSLVSIKVCSFTLFISG